MKDRFTGEVKFGLRYYSPTTGGWTQQDALNAPLSPKNANRYTYAGGDPINKRDPFGRLSLGISGPVCAFAGCVSGSIDVDVDVDLDDGDVNAGASVGVGGGGGVRAEADPDGDYISGEGGVSATASCNVGPANVSYHAVSGASNATVGTSSGVGCNASVGGNYTF